jgi:anti-sigma B factor antagonist
VVELSDDELVPAMLRVETVETDTGSVQLRLVGEADISTVPVLRSAIDGALRSAPERLLLDVGELSFIDSSGLAELLAAAHSIGTVVLRDPPAIVRRIVTMSGLDSILRMSP